MQTLGAMSLYVQPSKKSAFSAEEPSPYLVFLKSFKFVNDVGTNFHAIRCQMPSGSTSYDLKLWAFMFLPIIVVFVFVSISVIYEIAIELYNWTRPIEKDLLGTVIPRSYRSIATAFNDGISNGISWSSQLVVFALPTSISAAARAQDCSDISTGTYLKEFPIHSCSDEEFKKLQLIAWYMGLVWLLIPLFIAIILYSGPNALLFLKPVYGSKWNGTSFLSNFQFAWGDEVPNEIVAKLWDGIDLSAPISKQIVLNPGDKVPTVTKDGVEQEKEVTFFRADEWKSLNRIQKVRFGWEMAVILRKSVLMGIATGFAGVKNLISQILFTTIILVCFLIIHLRLDPYKYRRINYLDTMAYFCEICGCIYVVWHLSAFQPADVNTVSEAIQVQGALINDFYGFSLLAIVSVALYFLLLLYYILDSIGVFYCFSQRNDKKMNEVTKEHRKTRNSLHKFRIKNLKAPLDDKLHQFPTSQLVKSSEEEKSSASSKKGVKTLGLDKDGKDIVLELDTRFLDKNKKVILVGDVVLTLHENREARVVKLFFQDSVPFADISYISEVARKYDLHDSLRGKKLNPDTLLTEEEVLARLKAADGKDSFDIMNPMLSRRTGQSEVKPSASSELKNPKQAGPMRSLLVNSYVFSRVRKINDDEGEERDENGSEDGRDGGDGADEMGAQRHENSQRVRNFNENADEEEDGGVNVEEGEEEREGTDDDVHVHSSRRLRSINDDDEEEEGDEEGERERQARARRFMAQPRSLGGWALNGGIF